MHVNKGQIDSAIEMVARDSARLEPCNGMTPVVFVGRVGVRRWMVSAAFAPSGAGVGDEIHKGECGFIETPRIARLIVGM